MQKIKVSLNFCDMELRNSTRCLRMSQLITVAAASVYAKLLLTRGFAATHGLALSQTHERAAAQVDAAHRCCQGHSVHSCCFTEAAAAVDVHSCCHTAFIC